MLKATSLQAIVRGLLFARVKWIFPGAMLMDPASRTIGLDHIADHAPIPRFDIQDRLQGLWESSAKTLEMREEDI